MYSKIACSPSYLLLVGLRVTKPSPTSGPDCIILTVLNQLGPLTSAVYDLHCTAMQQDEDGESPICVLPDELLLQLFSMLPAKDLCSIMQTCRRFRELCSVRTVLAASSFSSGWPSVGTESIYKR